MKLTKRIGKVHKTYAWIGCGMGLLAAVAVASTVGSPLPILHLLGAGEILPPVWILSVLWLMGYGILGGAAGHVLACAAWSSFREAVIWRGLTFLVIEVTFSFAWYSLSFGSFHLVIAWICLMLGVVAGGICTLSWFSVQRIPAMLCGGVTLWFLYLALCHLVVILHN